MITSQYRVKSMTVSESMLQVKLNQIPGESVIDVKIYPNGKQFLILYREDINDNNRN